MLEAGDRGQGRQGRQGGQGKQGSKGAGSREQGEEENNQCPMPHTQSPIPNPQSPIPFTPYPQSKNSKFFWDLTFYSYIYSPLCDMIGVNHKI